MIFVLNIPKLSKVKVKLKTPNRLYNQLNQKYSRAQFDFDQIRIEYISFHLTELWNNVQNLVRKPCNVLEFFWPSALSCHMCASTLNVGLSHPTSREVPGSCRMQKKSALSSDTKVVNASKNFNYIWNGYNNHCISFLQQWKRSEQ